GISLIDIGHWESEQYFTKLLMGLLPENLKNKQLQAIMSNSNNPFTNSGE
ncbi:MAG: Nif3-like dinuclear metal center hexameric protein, partial [Campylobacterales bacterium]|nr:Nif3-like dinuclear metal center hexameric protein [Campylobacterales bacterium]